MGDNYGVCTFAFNGCSILCNFKHFHLEADDALKIYDRAGYLEYTRRARDIALRILFHDGNARRTPLELRRE